MLSVLIADDHALIREGLRRAFENEADFEVVGEAASATEAMRVAAATRPAVAVIDVRLPDGSGLDVVRALRRHRPQMGLVVLTMYAGDQQIFDALDAGASAFVPKSAPAEDVVEAARHAASAPTAFTAADLAEAMRRRMNPDTAVLSPREREVLQLLADGLSVAQISRTLFISDSTTKTHISKVYDKLGAANRAQALMAALRLGLLRQSGPGD